MPASNSVLGSMHGMPRPTADWPDSPTSRVRVGRWLVAGALLVAVGAIPSATAAAVASVNPLRHAGWVMGGIVGLAVLALLVGRMRGSWRASPRILLAAALLTVGVWIGYAATWLTWPTFRVASAAVSGTGPQNFDATGYCVSATDRPQLWYIQAEERSAPLIGFFVGRGHVVRVTLTRPGRPDQLADLRAGDRFDIMDGGVVRQAEVRALDEAGLLQSATTDRHEWSCTTWREVRAPLHSRRPLDWFLGTNRPFRVVPLW